MLLLNFNSIIAAPAPKEPGVIDVTSVMATSSLTNINPVPEPVTSIPPAEASPVVNKSPTCGVGCGLGSVDVLL